MSRAYSDAFDAGETDAIARMVDFYGGAGTFAAWPQRVRDYAIETTSANLLDWKSAYGFRLTPAVTGDRENSHARSYGVKPVIRLYVGRTIY